MEGPLLFARNKYLLYGVQTQGDPATEPALLGFLDWMVPCRLDVAEPAP